MATDKSPLWIFPPPSNNSPTYDFTANFGPVYLGDSIRLEWEPDVEITPPKNITGGCTDNNFDWLSAQTNLSSPHVWPMNDTYNHDYIPCWFCIWSAEQGNTVSFHYVSSISKDFKTWSVSTAVSPTSSPTSSTSGPTPGTHAGGGISESDKLGLGIGLGVGLAALLVAIVGVIYQIKTYRKS